MPQTARSTAYRTNPKIDDVIRAGARRRNITVAAYARRAAVAFACYDLGLSWSEVMDGEPGFGLFGEYAGKAAIYADGEGFGPWKITGLDHHFGNE